MNLFVEQHIRLHSGECSEWKIECDTLTDDDIKTLALMLNEILPPFHDVYGVPTGGTRIAKALKPYASGNDTDPQLIVDDVLTTGNSMEGAKKGILGTSPIFEPDPIGAVLFARGKCPDWIIPLFQMPITIKS